MSRIERVQRVNLFNVDDVVAFRRFPDIMGRIVSWTQAPSSSEPEYDLLFITGDETGNFCGAVPQSELVELDDPPLDDPEALARWLES